MAELDYFADDAEKEAAAAGFRPMKRGGPLLPAEFDIPDDEIDSDMDKMEDAAHSAMEDVRFQILTPEFYPQTQCTQCGIRCRSKPSGASLCARCAIAHLGLVCGTYAAEEYGDACLRLKQREELVLARAMHPAQ